MRKTQRLWQALERVPGLTAVSAEWREHLGDEWDVAQSLLRPRQDLATSVPCPSVPKCECAHTVVTHAPNDIVAVCRCQPERCDRRQLERADIVVWEVDRRKLGAGVAAALGSGPEWQLADGLPMTWRIGTYVPSAGFRFPIYLTIQSEDHDFQRTVEGLVTRNDGPFILAAPTHDLLNSVGGAVLERGGVSFVALSELLALGKDGSPVAAESAAPLLDRLRAALVGEPATPEGAELPHCRVVTLKGTHTMDSDEYKELVARASEYDLFIDGISRNALRRYDGEAMAPEMLTPGEFAMIAEYIESRKIMRPTGTKVGTGKTADTARKLFDRGRRKVDISLQRYVWLYFRTHKATEPDATAFEFSPPEGTSWCLILPAQT